MPEILNKRHDGIPPGAVYIGRGSKWGNPFVIPYDGDRASVIWQYELYLNSNPELLEAVRVELRGKDLVCFCSPLPCHGDLLLSVANPQD